MEGFERRMTDRANNVWNGWSMHDHLPLISEKPIATWIGNCFNPFLPLLSLLPDWTMWIRFLNVMINVRVRSLIRAFHSDYD